MEMDDNPMVTVAASMPRVDIWVPPTDYEIAHIRLSVVVATPSVSLDSTQRIVVQIANFFLRSDELSPI